MKPKFLIILFFCTISVISCKRNPKPLKQMGDDAPLLYVKQWIKGKPVDDFEKDKIYVIEFWATWCGPCKAAMPHLSALSRQYNGKVNFIAVDVWEKLHDSKKTAKEVVDKMGNKMDFAVAAEDSNFMASHWLKAAREGSIPSTFVINGEGKVAWIAHPKDLAAVLPKIVNNTWGAKDIKQLLATRAMDDSLEKWDLAANEKLRKYAGKYHNNCHCTYAGKPDSALIAIDSIVKKEPRLKYMPTMACTTFYYLLQTNPEKAYEYGQQVTTANINQYPPYSDLIGRVIYLREQFPKIKLPANIYRLAAEWDVDQIEKAAYPELMDPVKYQKAAAWYKLAGDNTKAAACEQKYIEAKKSREVVM